MALGLIDEKTAKRENWHIILDRDGLERAQAVSREMIDRKQAQAYLGIPRGIMPSILEAGLLKPLAQGGDKGKGSMVFLRSELDGWIEQLAGDAPFLPHKISGFGDIVATSRQAQWTSAAIVEALLDGRLQAAGRIQDEPPFMSIMIDVVEARKLMMETCDVPVATGLSWDQAVAAIGCTHYVLKDLVAKEAVVGKLMKSISRGSTLMVFEPDEIARLNRKYISMKAAAAYLGAHSRSVAARVAPLGIKPAIEIDDLPASSFFLRTEIEALEQYAFESPRTRKSRLARSG